MRTVILAAALVLGAATTLVAQPPIAGQPPGAQPPAGAPPVDPLGGSFFPPDLIMAHQAELGLQDSQRATIMTELQQAQAKFVELQWRMSAEAERLAKLVQPTTVNEAQALDQIDRTLAVEREIKRTQIALLIRIKNALTPQQQAKLAALRPGR